MNKLLFVISILFLIGCNSNYQPIPANPSASSRTTAKGLFEDKNLGFSVLIPSRLPRWTTWSKGLDSGVYPSFTTEISDSNEIRVTIFNNTSTCSPEKVGIYPTSAIKNDSGGIITIRGKADYADKMKGDYDHTHEPTCIGGYAFCSEHAGKQVTICISQQTDDPKLANEIFDSFRWLSTDKQHDQP